MHDIEDTIGQAGVFPHLGHQVGGRGILLGRLDDHGVARGNRDREEPHRHHGREVEGRDDADHSEGLANRVDVNAGGHALGETTLEQVRDTASELDDLHATGDLTQSVGEHLAVLLGDDRGNFLLASVENLAEGEENRCALGQRGVAPAREGGLGGGNGVVENLRTGEIDSLGDLAGGGVVDIARALGRAFPELSVNPVSDARGHDSCFRVCWVMPVGSSL